MSKQAKIIAEEYDYIVVGMGYAGAIMTARLAQRAKGKKILAIEYGGPVHASTGGATAENVTIEMTADMFQNSGLPNAGNANPEPVTMPDVPGNYNNVAFREKYGGGKFDMKEFPSCWQGVGLGGNGLYNGALYQEPADWWWNDDVHNDIFLTEKQKAAGNKNTYDIMKGYFKKVRAALDGGMQSHPSEDGIHYNHGLYDIIRPHLLKNNFDEVAIDTLDLTPASNRFFTVPAVNVKHGVRTGPRAWLEMVIDNDGNVKEEFPNLSLLTFAKVEEVCLDSAKTVTGVKVSPSGARRGGLNNHKAKDFDDNTVINVKEGGKVIMCCNALPTARVLYKSGIGCKTLNQKVMPGSKDHGTVTFTVDNLAVGTVVSEHVSTSLGMKYTGPERPQPHAVHYDPGDYVGNIDFLKQYSRFKSGPYAQYGPVVASHFVADMSEIEGLNKLHPGKEYESALTTGVDPKTGLKNVTTELFYNPYGLGHPAPPVSNPGLNPYSGPGTFTIACMLLSPEMRGLFRLKDDNNTAQYVEVYMSDGVASWDPSEEERKELVLPDYRKQAEHDVGVMTASIKEVLSLTANDPHIDLTLGPGDKQTLGYEVPVKDADGNYKSVAIGDLDPTNADHVRAYVQFYDKQEYQEFTVNGEYLPITRWQENHYHSTAPLARNLDVFGNELGDRKSKYGVDPDTCEVRGTKGLCVADSSLFPKVVYCHPIGAVMAVAEWAADQICPEEPDATYASVVQSSQWKMIGDGGRLKQVSISASGEHLWGVNSTDKIYYRAGFNGSWKLIPGSLKYVSVSAGGNHVWGVNVHDDVYYRAGLGGSWKKIDGKLKQICVSADGAHVWGVTREDHIYYKAGIEDGSWKLIAGSLKQVCVSASGKHVWGVNTHDHVYYRAGVSGSWKKIDGSLKHVSVSAGGNHVWGVTSEDHIYYREGLSAAAWTKSDGALKQVCVSADGRHVWGVNSKDEIWYRFLAGWSVPTTSDE